MRLTDKVELRADVIEHLLVRCDDLHDQNIRTEANNHYLMALQSWLLTRKWYTDHLPEIRKHVEEVINIKTK